MIKPTLPFKKFSPSVVKRWFSNFWLSLSKRQRVVYLVASLCVVSILAAATVWKVIDNRNKHKPVTATVALGSQAVLKDPQKFISIQKENIANQRVSDADKLRQRIDAANYYSNTYQFDKLLSELQVISQEFNGTDKDQYFLTSSFIAYQHLGKEEDAHRTAKQIVELEKQGVKAGDYLFPALREVVENYAR